MSHVFVFYVRPKDPKITIEIVRFLIGFNSQQRWRLPFIHTILGPICGLVRFVLSFFLSFFVFFYWLYVFAVVATYISQIWSRHFNKLILWRQTNERGQINKIILFDHKTRARARVSHLFLSYHLNFRFEMEKCNCLCVSVSFTSLSLSELVADDVPWRKLIDKYLKGKEKKVRRFFLF